MPKSFSRIQSHWLDDQVRIQCAFCAVIKIWSNGNSGGAPWWSYWSADITNTIGPTMVLLMVTIVYGMRYTGPENVCTLLVAGGVSIFALLKTSSKTMSKLAHPNAPVGYGLCFLNLTFDGFTNATQDSIKARNEFVGYYLQYDLHVWLAKCQWVEAVQFCKQHPEAAWDILMYCLCGAVGQSFIFLTISRFGSLTNTTITTMRKFVSIVVSFVLSGNPLSTKQWTSVIMVFSGLSYQIYLKWKKLQRMPKKKST
ncbi:UDP-galactose/UDP-glucose transporter 3 [Capsicum annuum]|nr:UDP-galactose/UDP-glucose transporter 3 [Capsicum annuum]